MTNHNDTTAMVENPGVAIKPVNPDFVGETLVAGRADGPIFKISQPLSFWGGFDANSGLIIDERHPEYGSNLAGKIIVMPHAKGSSSSSSVLAEAIRNGNGPLGIILRERDLIICIGAIVAKELYDADIPVIVLDHGNYEMVSCASGHISISPGQNDGQSNLALHD